MATPGIFVTGTNTGVGKTIVATAIVRLLASQGLRVVGLKPIASGSERAGPSQPLRNTDALELQAASSFALPYEAVNPFCFEPAIAPHIAAAETGTEITSPALLEWYDAATAGADIAVVEGAGGWRVPAAPGRFLERPARTAGPRRRAGRRAHAGLPQPCPAHGRGHRGVRPVHMAGLDRQCDRSTVRAPRRKHRHARPLLGGPPLGAGAGSGWPPRVAAGPPAAGPG